jgi:hypothetical protein
MSYSTSLFDISPTRWGLAASVTLLFIVWAIGPADAFGRKSDICGSWNNYCKGPPAQSSPRTYNAPSQSRPAPRRGPSAAEIERRRKKAEATRLNKLGISAWNRKDWGEAVRYFKAALGNAPTDKVILGNLNRAKSKLEWEQREKKDARETAAAKARINRMLDGLADQVAGTGSGPGASALFDSGDGPEGFPTPSGRVGMIDVFDAPPGGAPKAEKVPEPPKVPAVTIEKPPLYSKGAPGSAPVAVGSDHLPTVNPADFKAFNPTKGVKFNEVPPPTAAKPAPKTAMFDAEGWRLDAKGNRIPGSRQIWSDKYQAYVDEFGRIHRRWPGPTNNPEGRLPNPLDAERQADAKLIEKGLENAILNQDKLVWPGPTRDGEKRPPPQSTEKQDRAMATDSKVISESLEKAILNHDKTRVWPGPAKPRTGAADR